MSALQLVISELVNIFILLMVLHTRRGDRLSEATVAVMYLLGILSCFPAALLEIWGLGATKGQLLTFGEGMIVALAEEGFKGAITAFFLLRAADDSSAPLDTYDGILYGVIPALGFSFLENICYVAASSTAGIGFYRVLASLGHLTCGVILGASIAGAMAAASKGDGLATFARLLGGFAFATLVHGVYDSAFSVAFSLLPTHLLPGMLIIPFALVGVIFVFDYAFGVCYMVHQYRKCRTLAAPSPVVYYGYYSC